MSQAEVYGKGEKVRIGNVDEIWQGKEVRYGMVRQDRKVLQYEHHKRTA